MIDGEKGEAIFDQVIAHRMDAVIDGDSITASLIGACIADALRKGETPRSVARGLYDGLPDDMDWEDGIRETVEAAIEQYEEAQPA